MKSKRLKLVRNLSATALILFSASCTTTKVLHVPVGCEGQPNISLGFTEEEANLITDDMEYKISVFAVTLRKRIDSQCEINKKHDETLK